MGERELPASGKPTLPVLAPDIWPAASRGGDSKELVGPLTAINLDEFYARLQALNEFPMRPELNTVDDSGGIGPVPTLRGFSISTDNMSYGGVHRESNFTLVVSLNYRRGNERVTMTLTPGKPEIQPGEERREIFTNYNLNKETFERTGVGYIRMNEEGRFSQSWSDNHDNRHGQEQVDRVNTMAENVFGILAPKMKLAKPDETNPMREVLERDASKVEQQFRHMVEKTRRTFRTINL